MGWIESTIRKNDAFLLVAHIILSILFMTTDQEHHGWSEKQEKLISKWAQKAAGYRWLHNHARLLFKNQHDWLSYPTIIMSSITGVGGFAVLNPSSTANSATKGRILIIQYFFAFMNVASGIINSVSKFNNCGKLMETHSLMCVQYSKFYRNIDMELSLEPNNRDPALEFVTKCRMEYDRLLSESPDIPASSITAFNKQFPCREEKPDVCNGLSILCEEPPSPSPLKLSSILNMIRRPSRTSLEVQKV
jgi:hypothetical protein